MSQYAKEISFLKAFRLNYTYNFRDFLEKIERYSFLRNHSTVRHVGNMVKRTCKRHIPSQTINGNIDLRLRVVIG